MKNSFFVLLLLAAFPSGAQVISGLYAGTLVNDSTKKQQRYELALSEYREKITGYSYTTFVVNDTFYYSIKRVKATRQNGALLVEDVKMLVHNFPEAPAKGVRQQMTIPLNQQEDTASSLNGKWNTTQTKIYYALKGGLDMKREADSAQSALINHLYEINELQRPVYQTVAVSAAKTSRPAPQAIAEKPVVKSTPEAVLPQAAVVALPYQQRAVKQAQVLAVASDSLVLSFYDNGVVDGDTISVFFNNENIISQTKLTAAAAKKTVYLQRDAPEQTLLLVAENLGTIPPNTGLLMIQDGPSRYEIRFSADLQTNAAITFRRKENKL